MTEKDEAPEILFEPLRGLYILEIPKPKTQIHLSEKDKLAMNLEKGQSFKVLLSNPDNDFRVGDFIFLSKSGNVGKVWLPTASGEVMEFLMAEESAAIGKQIEPKAIREAKEQLNKDASN